MNEYLIFLAYILGIAILFFLGRVSEVPMKIIMRIVYNIIIGAIVLLVINFIGGQFGFNINFNVVTALITGFLGVPGVLLLVLLKFIAI